MAKKKRKPGGEKPQRRRRPAAAPDDLPDLPDRRAMERAMRDLVSGPGPDTALGRAQDVMYQAFAEKNDRRRQELARKALTISPDCADAYVLLAENAPSRKAAHELYERGVAAGERALGPQAFQEHAGHFWGVLETRPYMRARLGLAHSLWVEGRREEAIVHAQEMLRLNPRDNQGIRYTLAGWLLSQDRDDALARLLEQFADDGMAAWVYTRALLAFRRQGDTPEARKLLEEAMKNNKHVPAYLLGDKFPPPEQPNSYSPGAESEALMYIGSFLAGWRGTPGAIAWLRQFQKGKRKPPEVPQPKGPLGFIKQWLKKRLPQEHDVWQADFRQLPVWLKVAGEKVRPWILLVTNRSDDLVLAHDLLNDGPSPALVWDKLAAAMQNPHAGEPHRPGELQVLAHEHWEALRPHIEEVGIRLVTLPELDQLDAAFAGLVEHVAGKPRPGLLDVPGMTPAMAGSFYEAAALYYQQAPWRSVGYEDAIKVECGKFQSGPWYAVVMGQSGLTFGLALYDDLNILRRMWSGEVNDDEENARGTVGMSVIFGEDTDIAVADLEAAQQHGWKVARPDAYPLVFRKERGKTMRPPLTWELELLEACLRAMPDFVKRRPQDDPTREEVTVQVASGELTLGLSWVMTAAE